MVADALESNNWVWEVRCTPTISITHLLEFVQLWELVQAAVLHNDRSDTTNWKLSTSGEYSSRSAYRARFLGTTAAPVLSNIWRTWAPPECKIFAWLILQNRAWSSNRLARRVLTVFSTHFNHQLSCKITASEEINVRI